MLPIKKWHRRKDSGYVVNVEWPLNLYKYKNTHKQITKLFTYEIIVLNTISRKFHLYFLQEYLLIS